MKCPCLSKVALKFYQRNLKWKFECDNMMQHTCDHPEKVLSKDQ